MTYENDASPPKKKWLRKEHEDIIILLKIFVQKNEFCMEAQISDSADTCRRDTVESGRETMSGLLSFILIAIWIGTVIAKNSSGSSKKRTTYINGKPVEPTKKNNWNTEHTGNTTYRSSTSYKSNSSYSSQAGSRNSTDTYRQMQGTSE